MTETVNKQTILVVDDMPANIDVLVGLLSDKYRVKAARNGRKALSIARSENPPDLILMDVVMPEMDGYEACRRLKAESDTAAIPVIFVTSLADD
ncbi:MAG: response regulator, partial [Vulcanimicrobiota bacterium]